MKHRHSYGPWTMVKIGKYADLPDKEFISSCWVPPFWKQECECGFEQWIRGSKRPLARYKFREMWGSKVL